MPSGSCHINTILYHKWLQKLTFFFLTFQDKLLSEGHYYVFLKEEQRRPGKCFTTLSWGGGTGNGLFQGFPRAFLGLEQAGSPQCVRNCSLKQWLIYPCQQPYGINTINNPLLCQYTEITQRDGLGREVGGEPRVGDTCTPMAGSYQCMAKATTVL